MGIGKYLISESELQRKHGRCVINTLNTYTPNIYYAVSKFIENNAEMFSDTV